MKSSRRISPGWTGRRCSGLLFVADLDVICVAFFEPEADAPLVVDRDRMLAGAIPFERVQAVARRYAKSLDPIRSVDRRQLPQRASFDFGWQATHLAGDPESFGLPVGKRPDHASPLYCVT
jgi:hypothetical protein